MSEYMKNYRLTHPEYREYEKKRDVIYAKLNMIMTLNIRKRKKLLL